MVSFRVEQRPKFAPAWLRNDNFPRLKLLQICGRGGYRICLDSTGLSLVRVRNIHKGCVERFIKVRIGAALRLVQRSNHCETNDFDWCLQTLQAVLRPGCGVEAADETPVLLGSLESTS